MKFILSFALISTFGFALQTCEKSSSKAVQTDKTATNTVAVNTTGNTSAPAAPHQEDDAPRISLADAKKAYDDGTAVIVDSRSADGYKVEHIKNSINVPLAEFETTYKTIPTDKKIIVYCS